MSSERTSTDEKDNSGLPDYCKSIKYLDASGQVKELILPRTLDVDRPKRDRTIFNRKQLEYMENEFARRQYLTRSERNEIAEKLHLTETQVKVWFQNRRTKSKKQTRSSRTTDQSDTPAPTCPHATHPSSGDVRADPRPPPESTAWSGIDPGRFPLLGATAMGLLTFGNAPLFPPPTSTPLDLHTPVVRSGIFLPDVTFRP